MTIVRIIRVCVRVPRVAIATIQGWDRCSQRNTLLSSLSHFVRLFLLLQLLLSTKNLTSREVKPRNSLHFYSIKKIFLFEFTAAHDLNLWVDLTQRIPTQII